MNAPAAVPPILEVRFQDARVSAMLHQLHAEPLHSVPSVRQFALKFDVSESYLRHKFKEMVGLPFGQYVRTLRFRRARVLLERGGITVKQARLEVGMLDHSSFARAYKGYFGEAPSSTKCHADRKKWNALFCVPSKALSV